MTGSDDAESRGTGAGGAAGGRDAVLDMLEDAIEESHRKVMSGRVTDPEREEARATWHKTLAQLANSYRLMAKDRDLEDMADRVTALEDQQRRPDSGTDTGSDRFRVK
jgi:hypothetical protein